MQLTQNWQELNEASKAALIKRGRSRIEWAAREMPVLVSTGQRFAREQPFDGLRIVCCMHVTTETANLIQVLKAGGAKVCLVSSNPLSAQEDVTAALADLGVSVFAQTGTSQYYRNIHAALDHEPHITMDDGADLISTLHQERPNLISKVLGGTEETTSGVTRLQAMAAEDELGYPVIAVNDSQTKYLFDNRYGTGQSTLDGILRATNLLIAGKKVVVGGYGWGGRGLAARMRGMGANVVVIEVDPLRALEAVMDGYQVMPSMKAAQLGDLFAVSTGNTNVLDEQHFEVMKDGALLVNAGHFDVEINVRALQAMAVAVRRVRAWVDEYVLHDGRRIYLLCEGRLANLIISEGHPSAVMDLSFANQALGAEYIAKNYQHLKPAVHTLPFEIDREIASLKLHAMGIEIDSLTEQQQHYLTSWRAGT